MRVAQLLYEAILTGCVTTKRWASLSSRAIAMQADPDRDIYYKDVQLFRTQPVVDKVSSTDQMLIAELKCPACRRHRRHCGTTETGFHGGQLFL